jgi:hypothetical protein
MTDKPPAGRFSGLRIGFSERMVPSRAPDNEFPNGITRQSVSGERHCWISQQCVPSVAQSKRHRRVRVAMVLAEKVIILTRDADRGQREAPVLPERF